MNFKDFKKKVKSDNSKGSKQVRFSKIAKRHYFSQGSNININNQPYVTKLVSPFSIQFEIKELNNIHRTVENKKKYHEKFTYRTRASHDLLKRTFIEMGRSSFKTVIDVDPEYFSIIEGRPVQNILTKQDYLNSVRKSLLTKLEVEFRKDEILRIDELFKAELQMIDNTEKDLISAIENFNNFLALDYQRTLQIIEEANQLSKITREKDAEYKDLSRELGNLKIQIYILEEKWRTAKTYQKFLYQASPINWRKQFDKINWRSSKDFWYKTSTGLKNIEPNENLKEISEINKSKENLGTIPSSQINLDEASSIASLSDLINTFEDDIRIENEPKFYFNDPNDLLQVFREMELQNLNSLIHSEELNEQLETMMSNISTIKKLINKNLSMMQESIDETSTDIEWYEKRANNLSKKAKGLINSVFRETVASNDVLKLYVYVEDVYETVIEPNSGSMSIVDLFKRIEIFYEKCLLEQDWIPLKVIQKAQMEYDFKEWYKMTKATEAYRKVKLIDNLTKKLRRALEDPPKFVGKQIQRPLMFRSTPKQKKK